MKNSLKYLSFFLVLIINITISYAESLESYAKKCDAATRITIPDFNCDAGTTVPTKNHIGEKCDHPNRLHGKCDPGSKFQVLVDTKTSYAVAHCRKTGLGLGKYSDIAVIQTNRITGATCFYQALSNRGGPGDLDGRSVKAPSKGVEAWRWLKPRVTSEIKCVSCHDNGAILRTPYLSQLKSGRNKFPGASDNTFNKKGQPYGFIGEDFSSWKTYHVEVKNNACLGCHRLGISNQHKGFTTGTALDYSIKSTNNIPEAGKNPHSSNSPIWMPPGGQTFNKYFSDAAKEIRDCAKQFKENAQPNTDKCRIREITMKTLALGKNEAGDRLGESVATGDFNADGILDLVVGAPGEAPGSSQRSGAVFVYLGTKPNGLKPWHSLTQSHLKSNGKALGLNENNDLFGQSVAVGDFNGDGFDDLAVGAPGESPGSSPKSGSVFLFKGSSVGLTAWKSVSQTNFRVSNEKGDQFGFSLSSGDFNGDKIDDLAVGTPGKSPGSDPKSGSIYVFKGSSAGLMAWKGFDQRGFRASNEKDDRFGFSLAAGDFNGDKIDDLAVGTPGESPGSDPKSGNIFIFKGSSTGLRAWKGFDQRSFGAKNEKDDRFGFSLASGDFDGDNKDDLAVGTPGESPDTDPKSGNIFVFKGSSTGLKAWKGFDQRSFRAKNERDDQFGFSLAAGDFNGDNKDDLAIGTPGESPDTDPKSGNIFVFKGSSAGLRAWKGFDQRIFRAKNERDDRFGRSLAAGDFNGDGRDDLAVGTPGESPGSDPKSGVVFVFKGSSGGLGAWKSYGQE